MVSGDLARIEFVKKMIDNIDTIVQRHGGVTSALEDEVEGQMALLMCLEQIGETLNKLKTEKIRAYFDPSDIKGAYDVRLFIAHDYEGVNLYLIERIIREKIPTFSLITEKILKDYHAS